VKSLASTVRSRDGDGVSGARNAAAVRAKESAAGDGPDEAGFDAGRRGSRCVADGFECPFFRTPVRNQATST